MLKPDVISFDGIFGIKMLVVRSTDYVGRYKGHKADVDVLVSSLM